MEFELKNVQDLVFQRLTNSLAQAEGKLKDEMRHKLSQVDEHVSEIAEDQQTIQHNFRQLEKKVANAHFSASGSNSNFDFSFLERQTDEKISYLRREMSRQHAQDFAQMREEFGELSKFFAAEMQKIRNQRVEILSHQEQQFSAFRRKILVSMNSLEKD
jgi:septal ring factor EnvC (AmiA/AmiB activator)